jgi:hydroxymethylglutaryl-CoA reductase
MLLSGDRNHFTKFQEITSAAALAGHLNLRYDP